MAVNPDLSYRPADVKDFELICNLPNDAEELFFMFPKAEYPLTVTQFAEAVSNRYDSTVILLNNVVVGFANFYEVVKNHYCSIGHVIVSPDYRNSGIGAFLIKTMEQIASEKYSVSELRLSCFNNNTKGILLYTKLEYIPYAIEQRIDKAGNQIALIKMKNKRITK